MGISSDHSFAGRRAPIAYFVKQNEREKEKEFEKETGKLAEDMEQKHTLKNLYGGAIRYLVCHKGRHVPKGYDLM